MNTANTFRVPVLKSTYAKAVDQLKAVKNYLFPIFSNTTMMAAGCAVVVNSYYERIGFSLAGFLSFSQVNPGVLLHFVKIGGRDSAPAVPEEIKNRCVANVDVIPPCRAIIFSHAFYTCLLPAITYLQLFKDILKG